MKEKVYPSGRLPDNIPLTEWHVNPEFIGLTIPGNRPFDSGRISLTFPGMSWATGCTPNLEIRITNIPKYDSLHTGDFAGITVRASYGPQTQFIVIDKIVIDGLSCPDFPTSSGLAPDQTLSQVLIDGIKSPDSQKLISDLEPDSFFVTRHQQGRRSVIEGSKIDLNPDQPWLISGTDGQDIDIKRMLRDRLMAWMIRSLQNDIGINEKDPIHWHAGVYSVQHIYIDIEDEKIFYLFIGSGDVEEILNPSRDPRVNPKRTSYLKKRPVDELLAAVTGKRKYIDHGNATSLHTDLNWPADTMAREIGIQGTDRYPGKVYQIYDVVSPRSSELAGPFSLRMAGIKRGVKFVTITDGYKEDPGNDDVTSIELSIYV